MIISHKDLLDARKPAGTDKVQRIDREHPKRNSSIIVLEPCEFLIKIITSCSDRCFLSAI